MTAAAYTLWERRITAPLLVFDLVDRFARDRGTAGPHPRVRGPVRYRIVATEVGGVRTELAEPFDMVMVRNVAGYDVWFGAVTRDGGPATRYRPDPLLPFVVEVAAERYQRVETVIALLSRPGTPQRFVLEPGWAYEFPQATSVPGATGPTLLRGTLHWTGGTGVVGARVRVDPPPANQPAPHPEYRTDETGNWVLAFDDAVATTTAAQVQVNPLTGRQSW